MACVLGSGGVLNKCSETRLLAPSIGRAMMQPRYASKRKGAVASRLGLKGAGVYL
jgi:hypothetical protein